MPGADPSPSDGWSTLVLRARIGRPLDDPSVRDLVAATAEAIGERQGVAVRVIAAGGDAIEVAVAGGEVAALGLVAELRRLTDRWHRGRFGSPLWAAPPEAADEF
jgi:hypothetical protein